MWPKRRYSDEEVRRIINSTKEDRILWLYTIIISVLLIIVTIFVILSITLDVENAQAKLILFTLTILFADLIICVVQLYFTKNIFMFFHFNELSLARWKLLIAIITTLSIISLSTSVAMFAAAENIYKAQLVVENGVLVGSYPALIYGATIFLVLPLNIIIAGTWFGLKEYSITHICS